jgi:ATP/ADP translocase
VLARLYSTMGAASMAGGLAGAAFGKTFARRVEPEFFLLAGAALLTAGALVSVVAHRIFAVEIRAESEWPMPGPKKGTFPWPRELAELLHHRYTVLMAGVGMAASIVGVLIEFQFYSSAATVAGSEQDLLNVFANFYIALNAAAVLIQLFGAPPLQRHLGVHGSLLILPAALTFASVVVAASASVLGRAALRVAEGGLKSSIHRSSWEQAYLPLDRPRRAVAKILVDGVASRLGEGTAAAVLILMATADGGELPWIPILMVFGSGVWVALTVALRRSRNSPGLVPDWERDLRPDLPIPDGCITVGTLGDGLQRHKLSQESNGRAPK